MFNRKFATLALVLGTTAIIGACAAETEPTDPAQGTDPAIENTDPAGSETAPVTPEDPNAADPAAPAPAGE